MTRHRFAIALSALLLAGPSDPLLAAEETKSLADRRLEVIKGTGEGRKVLDLPSAAKPPASAASGSTTSAAGAEPAAGPKSAVFSKLPPPSGKPLNAARRLEGGGIGLPGAASAASQAATSK